MSGFMLLVGAVSLGVYTQQEADAFIGAQHWNESGWYVDGGLKVGYSGFYCLCECNATAEGVFCKGGGLKPDHSKVADFLAVYSQTADLMWTGSVIAYNTPSPFTDTFRQRVPGGPANYTGTSPGPSGFVWRGYMTGVDCTYKTDCGSLCTTDQYKSWVANC
eukprot:TRINITY_DN29223_c0_g1_i1.p1 TRINITY_DN29223_c0_g1~~TRINITY_DN29223_c0_g1_i1.p1  ORF type:complete len:171 (+),score=40.59 TRINITY_DN29223_c0_g1_i1:28-513(+)